MSCSDTNLHLDENNTCVPCCSLDQTHNKTSSGTCCQCDEKNMGCLQSKDGHGTQKRSNFNGNVSKSKSAHSNFMNALVVFFTAIIVPVVVLLAYKKYYKRLVRSKRPKAKWRRHHNYEKVIDQEGCENDADKLDLIENEVSDSEDEVHVTFYGEERRRLLISDNHGSSSEMNHVNT